MSRVLVKSEPKGKVLVKGPQLMFDAKGQPNFMFGSGGGGQKGLPRTRTSQALGALGGLAGAFLGATGPHQSLMSLVSGMQGGAAQGAQMGGALGGLTQHLPGGRTRLQRRAIREGKRADYDKAMAHRLESGKDVGRMERITARLPGALPLQEHRMREWEKDAHKETFRQEEAKRTARAEDKLRGRWEKYKPPEGQSFADFQGLKPWEQHAQLSASAANLRRLNRAAAEAGVEEGGKSKQVGEAFEAATKPGAPLEGEDPCAVANAAAARSRMKDVQPVSDAGTGAAMQRMGGPQITMANAAAALQDKDGIQGFAQEQPELANNKDFQDHSMTGQTVGPVDWAQETDWDNQQGAMGQAASRLKPPTPPGQSPSIDANPRNRLAYWAAQAGGGQ